MKKIILILLVLIPVTVITQDLNIPDNPYDKADEFTKSKNSFNRERWFYEQRMYPNNYIPQDAFSKAIEQKNKMRNEQGFAFDNAVVWTNIGPTPGYYFSYTNISGRTTTVKYHPTNPAIIYLN